jgi:hypothetical protein
MVEHNFEEDDVKTTDSENQSATAEGRVTSSSRRRALVTMATVPVLMSIKARSVYAQARSSSGASNNMSATTGQAATNAKKK